MHGLGEDLGFSEWDLGGPSQRRGRAFWTEWQEHRKRQIRPAMRMGLNQVEAGWGKWVDFQSIWRQSQQNLPPS